MKQIRRGTRLNQHHRNFLVCLPIIPVSYTTGRDLSDSQYRKSAGWARSRVIKSHSKQVM
ncbi:hypothetical protein BC938DRAFT_473638 [Jimgerdemannia flammicorona]|uniref:Uncharacterized protein n=1 Tax=Jimgerdemannia flammicorona TaxID=994334 RepID=A0A433Q3P0_9FUNG|nr:hypothetical protein BC938DRAFT_473638 [Jimgerdemannia flammicorona]